MRRHGYARIATISHNAVIEPDSPQYGEATDEQQRQRRLEVRVGSFSPILVDFSSEGLRDERNLQISFSAQLWLSCCLCAIGSLITYLYLQAQCGKVAAPEESLPPRPGSISSSLQILCITSLSISYGAMVSSMTIFVLPKEAEHFFPKHSSISLGVLELLGAVSLLSGPIAGQVSATCRCSWFSEEIFIANFTCSVFLES